MNQKGPNRFLTQIVGARNPRMTHEPADPAEVGPLGASAEVKHAQDSPRGGQEFRVRLHGGRRRPLNQIQSGADPPSASHQSSECSHPKNARTSPTIPNDPATAAIGSLPTGPAANTGLVHSAEHVFLNSFAARLSSYCLRSPLGRGHFLDVVVKERDGPVASGERQDRLRAHDSARGRSRPLAHSGPQGIGLDRRAWVPTPVPAHARVPAGHRGAGILVVVAPRGSSRAGQRQSNLRAENTYHTRKP